MPEPRVCGLIHKAAGIILGKADKGSVDCVPLDPDSFIVVKRALSVASEKGFVVRIRPEGIFHKRVAPKAAFPVYYSLYAAVFYKDISVPQIAMHKSGFFDLGKQFFILFKKLPQNILVVTSW